VSTAAAVFELGSFALQSGVVLRDAKLVYRSYGTLLPDRSNAVLYPTSFGAHHDDIDWLVKPAGILDPSRYFVLIVNMFGNGLSSSASHGDGVPFAISHYDNVTAQDRLLREVFGIDQLSLVYGWSMGAQQAYHWAVLHPERVKHVAALCGTARTSQHNLVFLKSLEAALQADPAWDGARFVATPERGLRAFARIYASWGLRRRLSRAAVSPARLFGFGRLSDARLGAELSAPHHDGPTRRGSYHRASV
jgi:homoserine O-acetyltransferase